MMNPVQKSFENNTADPFKTLLYLYKGNYPKLALSGGLFLIKHIPAWVMPLAIANVINAAIAPDGKLQTIYINALVMLFLVGQNIFSNYFHIKFQSLSIRQVEANLRAALIEKLQELSIIYQKELQSGQLQSKIMRDVEAVQTLSSQIFSSSLNILINLVVALAITLYKSPIVFLFFLLTVPIAALIIVFFRKRIKKQNSDFRQEMEHTSAKVVEAIELAPIVRAHALETTEMQRLGNHFQAIYQKGFSLDILQSTFGSVSWASFQAFQLLCLVFTGSMALQGRIPAGDVVLYQTYFTTVVNSVSSLITLIPTISKGMESVRSIGEILTSGEIETYRGKQKVARVSGAFTFQQVGYSYPLSPQPVLEQLSFTVKAGETIALVGESGSGKSTILSLLIGFIQPSEGRLLLDGQEMNKLDLRSYRRFIAVVLQNTILFSGTIQENLTYGLKNISPKQIETALKTANLWEVVLQLPHGLHTQIGEHGDKLSGGQRQRLAIARALLRSPQIIFMDEATSALDNLSEKKIQTALNKLTKGKTTFIAAHRLSTIRDADKIAVIKNGSCHEFGTFEELMAQKGLFYQQFQSQIN
ncbi:MULTISPECIES: ABC transporter ATP-binding protein [Enterococcus]|uniref:ABC transporter ATP-binding protein n=1 Tax=Enterococcus TaxID=1350 RepID=UPI0010F7AD95|nr:MULTISPECIES: ABC transporter ATP-binding protein [Enterococcus]